MTVKRLYAAMKTFTILIRKIQCFHSIKRNCIKEFIGKKPVKSRQRDRGSELGKRYVGVRVCPHVSHVVTQPFCVPMGTVKDCH